MASWRYAGRAAGLFRLLLDQQGGGGGSAVAGAASRLWHGELRLAALTDGGGAAAAAAPGLAAVRHLHTVASLRPWLPAVAAAGGDQLLLHRRRGGGRRQQPWQQPWEQQGSAALHSAASQEVPNHQDSVKSHLTQPPPLAGVAPWDGHLPHQHLPHQHPRPASAAPQYEAADAGKCAGAGWGGGGGGAGGCVVSSSLLLAALRQRVGAVHGCAASCLLRPPPEAAYVGDCSCCARGEGTGPGEERLGQAAGTVAEWRGVGALLAHPAAAFCLPACRVPWGAQALAPLHPSLLCAVLCGAPTHVLPARTSNRPRASCPWRASLQRSATRRWPSIPRRGAA